MPGFWEYLQQFSDRDVQRRESLNNRQLQLAQMMGQFAQSDSDNAMNYAQLQNSGLAAQGGLLQSALGIVQKDQEMRNSIVAKENEIAAQRAMNVEDNQTSMANTASNNAAQIQAAGISASNKQQEFMDQLQYDLWLKGYRKDANGNWYIPEPDIVGMKGELENKITNNNKPSKPIVKQKPTPPIKYNPDKSVSKNLKDAKKLLKLNNL